MSNNEYKRRNIYINKAFQGRFILGVFLLILLSGLCSALLIYWITGGDLQAQSQTAHTNIMNSLEHLGLSLFLGNLVSMLIAGSVAIFVVLYASHKIAGPLYRFEKLCEQIGEDQLDTVTALREHDQLQELGKAFAVMATKLRNRKDKRTQLYIKLLLHIDQLQKDSTLATVNAEHLEQMRLIVAQLQE